MAIKEKLVGAWHGVRSPGSSRGLPAAQPPEPSDEDINYKDIRRVNTALLPLLALGLVAALWVGWRACAVGPVLLWCVACLAAGATVGFLFGIPRSGSQMSRQNANQEPANAGANAAAASAQRESEAGRPNTNLEEVSDWLTKILVGLSLVHLKSIEGRVWAISRNAAASLNSTPTDADISVATALVVGFSVIGFLCGYLYTRLFLQGAFSRSDNQMHLYRRVTLKELSDISPEPAPPSGQPSVPSSSDRQSAERIRQVAPTDRPEELLAPLRALAAEYEEVRRNMPFSPERTRKMSELASGMKRLALVTAPFLPQLTQSPSPGERLAAVIILQMTFEPRYIEWLANRLVEEPAFTGYQAASALLARMPSVGQLERQRIKAAVQAAMKKRVELGLEPEEERDKLVERILAA
ncbi:MAG: hypothetical protein ABIR56_07155 [Polaromonas sp.]